MTKGITFYVFAILMLLLLSSCNRSSRSGGRTEALNVINANAFDSSEQYFKRAKTITLEVFYEEGAVPFTGNININNSQKAIWGITEENLKAIFQFRTSPPQINLPQSLNQMTSFPNQDKESRNLNDIISLANQLRSRASTPEESIFTIIFANGFFRQNDIIMGRIIGINPSKTPVIVIFKNAFSNSSENQTPNRLEIFTEQSTIVHELGHALGFVNDGVPLSSDHQDIDNGNHTINDEGVMFYRNEGFADLVPFIENFMATDSKVLWGKETLNDARAFSD